MIAWLIGHWHDVAEVLGTALEIFGLVLAANGILRVPVRQLPKLFASALVSGASAKSAAKISEILAHDDITKSLRGLSFVMIGLALKATPGVAGLFH